MRKNQKGFTLVELIIAIAILAVVTATISGFIIVGSRSYASANTDIMLQQEAQLALNQISDVLIDTTDSINYGGKDDTSTDMEMVLKDSEFSIDPTQKCLTVVNKKDSNNDNPGYWFGWSKADETLYFNEVTINETMTQDQIEDGFKNADTGKNILAQHVTEFHIDISQFEENRVVMVSMVFENGNKQYTTSNNVTVRNKVAVNQITVPPMKKATEFTIADLSSVVLEPGDHYTFTAAVDTSADDKAVAWEIVGGAKNGTSIGEDSGELTVGLEEVRSEFKVKVKRKNEEYAGQNNRVAKEVTVKVKRATGVNVTCAESSVKPGSTVMVNASAVGNSLGVKCNSISCASDDPTKDKEVGSWRIVSGPATLGTTNNGSAEINVLSTAKADDQIVIEAVSTLSVNKHYGPESAPTTPPVTGRLTLKVEKGTAGDVPIKSGFKFGTDNDPGPLDYMRSHLRTDWGGYIYCVRVREMNSGNALNDQVVMYRTTGANERFNPDLFGLELDRSYIVTFQVLVPVSKETIDKKNKGEIGSYFEDPENVIVNEYLSNIDPSSGKYIGDKYEADDLYYGVLTPPMISLKYNGVTYPNDNDEYYEKYSIVGGGETVMGKPELGEAINVERNVIMHNIRYSLYVGEGDNIENWTRIYGFDKDSLNYTGSQSVPGGAISMNPDSSQFLKRDINNHNIKQAIGTYHIVPGYVYANDPNIRGGYDYLYKSDNLTGDYTMHYYEQPSCMITIKVDMGLNLELPRENGQERWAFFPVPTDKDFPFALKRSGEQFVSWNFNAYTADGAYAAYMPDITVKCKYNPGVNGETDSYTITLYSQQVSGDRVVTKHTYGVYKCKVGGERWDMVSSAADEIIKVTTNLTFTSPENNNTYDTYFPIPSEGSFPFKRQNAGEQSVSYQMTAFNTANSYDTLVKSFTVKCTYNNGKYIMEIIREEKRNDHKKTVYSYGKFEASESDQTWRSVAAGYAEDEAVWGALIYFNYESKDCKMELALPSESGFPSFTDSYQQSITGNYLYAADDEFGERGTSWVAVNIYYEYSNGVYTVTLKNLYNDNLEYGTWTCTGTSKEWTKVN